MKVVEEMSMTCKIKLKNKLNLQLPFILQFHDLTLPVAVLLLHVGLEALYGKSSSPPWCLCALSE